MATSGKLVQVRWWIRDAGTEHCVWCLRTYCWEDRRHCMHCDVSLCCICVDRPELEGGLLCPECIGSTSDSS